MILYSLILCVLLGPRSAFLPSTSVFPQPWGSQGESQNTWKFQLVSRTLKNQKKCPQGHRQTPKWHLKPSLRTPNYWISQKREITQNTLFLHWLWHMQPLHSGIISIPGSPKTRTWKLSPTLVSKITENHKNIPKVGPRGLPKSIPKSIKIDLGFSASRITKMVSPAPKKEPQGFQNDTFW